MLAKRIIPCLDVDRGRVVKGSRFVALVDAGDPVEQARRYDREGADELVFLDITASSDSRDLVYDMARRVADTVFIPFTVGGGIRNVEDMRRMLASGADKVSINTAAINHPAIITEGAQAFGSQAIVVAIDARRGPGAGGRGPVKNTTSGDVEINDTVNRKTGPWPPAPGPWEVYTHGGAQPARVGVIEWGRRGEVGGGGGK